MNVFAKFNKIPSMILQDIKETKRYGRYGHTVGRSVGQRENSIPSHKHSLRGYDKAFLMMRLISFDIQINNNLNLQCTLIACIRDTFLPFPEKKSTLKVQLLKKSTVISL